MSLQDMINFFKDYGATLLEHPVTFITFGLLCVTITTAILKWIHKKETAKLQEKINQMKEDAESHQQEFDSLKQENLSLNEEVKRLKKQFENLTIEGYTVALREGPEGVAAEKICRHFQDDKED